MGEPFNLPRGTVRACVTLGMVLGFVPVCIWGSETGVGAYSALAAVAVRDYFHARAEQNKIDGPALEDPVL